MASRDPIDGPSPQAAPVAGDSKPAAHTPRLREGRRVTGVDLEPGSVVAGRFRLEESLGEGGMGVVWRATHVVTRKPVALKFLKRSEDDDGHAVQRFLREARAACAVRHPSVVEVHDVLELEDGSPVMVMERLEGETLATRLDREVDRRLPLAEFGRIMVHVCSAVACAHSLGIVHRDLKPENIFLVESHGTRSVKVLDFGIAKLTALDGDAAQMGASTATGAILGTPYYMAPEQLFGEKDIDHRADIWALGIIFYQVLAGVLPTLQPNVGQIIKFIMTGGMPPLRERAPGLPGPIVALVHRMLSRDRAARPADLGEVLAVLSLFTDERFIPTAPLPPRTTPEASTPDVVYPADSPSWPRLGAGNVDTANASTVDAAAPTGGRSPRAPASPDKPRPWSLVVAGVGLAGVVLGAWLVFPRGAPHSDPQPSASVTVTQPALPVVAAGQTASGASAAPSASAVAPVAPAGSSATAPPAAATATRPTAPTAPRPARPAPPSGGSPTRPPVPAPARSVDPGSYL